MSKIRTGAHALVDVLLAQGVERVFCVPGESYLALLDALRDVNIETIVCRHEAAAANMAEATGKLTGRPGVALVTRGPGATHASIGLHTARQDSSPMILLIGQVARGDRARGAFQEIDYRQFLGPITKWADEIDGAARVPEFLERAFATAMQGRMGPVALALPEDMLTEASAAKAGGRVNAARPGLSEAAAEEIEDLLSKSGKPIFVLGGSDWDQHSARSMTAFANKLGAPVVLSFRRKHLIDNDDPIYAGDLGLGPNPRLIARIKEADLVIALGARLGENPSQGYSLFTRDEAARKLVHIHPDPQELGKVWPTRFAAVAHAGEAVQALIRFDEATPIAMSIAAGWRQGARADYEAFIKPVEVSGAVNLSKVFTHLAEALPDEAIVCNDAGNCTGWLHRFYRHRGFATQVAPTSGAMGSGVPAAIAAKLAFPEREVVGVIGDGGFLMSGQEMATCLRHNVAPIFLVIDNGSYGTIRMHQEIDYPGRVHATDLVNPDFAAYAGAFGIWSKTIERTQDFPGALEEARNAKGPALLHIKTEVEDIAPERTLSAIRTAAR